MITSVKLSNFKCFRALSLELGLLNVFAGMNGAGKSTVIQSLLAIRQSWESGSLAKDHIQLNGTLVDLGTAGEVYCADPDSESIEIMMRGSEQDIGLELRSTQSEQQSNEYFLRLDSHIGIEGSTNIFALFSEPFNYLHAERVGPRKVFPIALEEVNSLRVGKWGESAAYIIASELKETEIENSSIILESSDGKEYPTLHYQWALWMARLFPGFEAESEIYNQADQVRLALALQRQQTGQSLYVRPTNTGFGLSFVLGIIVAGLVAKPNTVLIVENPEAHLHPKAQSMIGEFLARVAAGRTQVFVETHSEHVLNGIRRMVKQTILTPSDVRFHFYARNSTDFEPSVIAIPVAASGDISSWPEGFFDQLDKDLSIILA
jgi:predicted ATPase